MEERQVRPVDQDEGGAVDRVRQLERELAAAEETIEALMAREVDAVIHPGQGGAVLLSEAQEALRESERRWRAIFETALDAIFVVDDEARFREANKAACELLGLPMEQLLEQRMTDLVPAGYNFEDGWSSFLASKRARGEMPVHRPDGDVRQTEYSGVANFLPGRHLFIVRDVTERREMEGERERALYQLGERVKEATLLHQAGYLLNGTQGRITEILDDIVDLIPPAWQYPAITAARIRTGEREATTDNYRKTAWRQRSHFHTGEGVNGVVEVVYLEERPAAVEGPFLAEERNTLDALAGMIQSALEREMAQERLRKSEARYRMQFETMVQGAVYQDALGRIVTANPAAERILGLSADELAGRTSTDPRWRTVDTAGEALPAEELPAEIALRTGEEVRNVVVGVYNQEFNGYRWLSVDAVPQFHPGETEPSGVYTTFEDVTERRQAEERLQRIVDSVPTGLLLLDGDRRVLLANPAAASRLALLLGWEDVASPEGVVGRRVAEVGGRPLQAFMEPPAEDELSPLLQAGDRLLEVAAYPLVEATEQGWVVILRDVTEEQQLQERLQQQERLASLGQLAAGIAHDFNNVMSAIFLYTQVLQSRPGLDEKDKERLDVIYRQAQHATNLIRQILDFSRRSVMERSALDLVPFVKEMFKLWRRTLPETIDLRLHHDAAQYVVDADPTRLQQAMMNLAINARDAMPEGGELSVALSSVVLQPGESRPLPEMEPGVWLRLQVSDTGEGIDDEALSRIFDPFYTTKPVGQGTGLGLSQVYGIIRQHGGHIQVTSGAGEGTTFTIYLPLMQKEAEEVEETVPEMPPPQAGRRTVLVAEDEEAARLALVETLNALGYEALGAEHGAAALALCRDPEQKVDLVVSDLVMPVMGGTELYHVLRDEFPAIRMVLMSGYPLDKESRALLEQETVVWMQKPFSVNELEARVREALGAA